MELLSLLILSHFLADYPLQTNAVYSAKLRDPWCMGVGHTLGVVCALLLCLAPYLAYQQIWYLIAIVSLVHYIQDGIKIELDKMYHSVRLAYVLDQLFHVSLLTAFWWFWIKELSLEPTFSFPLYENIWLSSGLIGLILVTYVWDITRFTFKDPQSMKNTPFVRDWKGMMRNAVLFLIVWFVFYWNYPAA